MRIPRHQNVVHALNRLQDGEYGDRTSLSGPVPSDHSLRFRFHGPYNFSCIEGWIRELNPLDTDLMSASSLKVFLQPGGSNRPGLDSDHEQSIRPAARLTLSRDLCSVSDHRRMPGQLIRTTGNEAGYEPPDGPGFGSGLGEPRGLRDTADNRTRTPNRSPQGRFRVRLGPYETVKNRS